MLPGVRRWNAQPRPSHGTTRLVIHPAKGRKRGALNGRIGGRDSTFHAVVSPTPTHSLIGVWGNQDQSRGIRTTTCFGFSRPSSKVSLKASTIIRMRGGVSVKLSSHKKIKKEKKRKKKGVIEIGIWAPAITAQAAHMLSYFLR